jgi:hypothetical protein
MNTKQLLQKADIALADLFNGGYMQPEQSNTFLRIMMEDAPMLSEVRMVRMNRPQMVINKLNLAERALRVANQGAISSPNSGDFGERALPRIDRTKVTTSKIDLNTFEAIAEVNIPYEVLEDNIEGGQIDNTRFEETVLSRLAERIRIDIEDLVINGDTTSADPFLSIRDGILRQASSNVVNNAGGPFDAVLMKTVLDSVPVQFKRLMPRFRMYASHSRVLDYMLQIAMRQTALGDTVLVGGGQGGGTGRGMGPFSPFGVPMVGVPNMPNDKAILIDPQNIIMGMQRQMRIEYDKDTRERVLIIVVTMRFDVKLEQEDQVVRVDNLGLYVPT